MKQLFIFLIILVAMSANSASFTGTFTPSPSESSTVGGVYGLYWQSPTTDNTNIYNYLGYCNEGQTEITFDTTNAPYVINLPNPVKLFVSYQVSPNTSDFTEAYLFNTNDFVSKKPLPPSLLRVSRK